MKVTDEDSKYFQEYLNSINFTFENKKMAIILAENKETGDIEPILCRAEVKEGATTATFTPMAILFRENPFEKFKPIMSSDDSPDDHAIVLAHQGSLDDLPHREEVNYYLNSNKNLN